MASNPVLGLSSNVWFDLLARRMEEIQRTQIQLKRLNPPNLGILTGILNHMLRSIISTPIVYDFHVRESLALLKYRHIVEQANMFFLPELELVSRCGSDSWPKLRKLRVRSDMGLGLSLCAVPLLQFGSQRSEEVGSECQSKVVAQAMIKTVNDEEGTNSRRRRQEEFVPNRQEDVEHDEESIKVDRSQPKLTWVCLS